MTNNESDPLARVKALRAERDRLTDAIKTGDREAVAEGTRRGMSVTEIGAAIGAAASHVYAIRKELREQEQQ